MNNEPVAWMDEINTFVLNNDYKQFSKNLQNGMIPLYTHPSEHALEIAEAIGFDKGYKAATAKTLTDEEIHLVREVLDGCVSIIKTEIVQEKQTFKGYEHCSNLPSLESELKDAEKAVVILKKLQGK